MVKSLKVIMFSKSLTRMGTLGYRTGDKWVPILVQEECVVLLVLGLRVQPTSARNIWRGTCDPKVVTPSGRIMSTPIHV